MLGQRWQLSVADYARMHETGILHEDDRVELIAGTIYAMSPISPIHAAIVRRINALLSRKLLGQTIISVQNPSQLDDYTEPQPDLAVLRWRDDYYAAHLPTGADVLLVIEVADSSLDFDRNEKLPRYAKAGIPEMWLINVGAATIEQYSEPFEDRYLSQRLVGYEQTLRPTSIPNLELAGAAVLG